MQSLKANRAMGMLNNPYAGELGGFGLKTYKERAQLASSLGVTLVDLVLSQDNAQAIRKGENVHVRFLDGKNLSDYAFPSHSIKVVFDYAWSGSSGTCNIADHEAVVAALSDAGARFINGPEAIRICNDKWLSYELFSELGIDTPATMRYTHANAQSLLEGSGFVFIKDTGLSEGKGQFTVSLGEGKYILKSDSSYSVFGGLGQALDTVESKANTDRCIVQEGIKMPSIDGRVYDFRALFQLNGDGYIVLPAVYMRFGAAGSYQSNISNGGYSMDPSRIYPDFQRIRGRMEEIGIEIFKGLQRKAGDVGEIGMDFLLSSDGRLYVLEINSRSGTKGIRDLAANSKSPEWERALESVLRNPIAHAARIMEEDSVQNR